jgi:thioredoxin-dependent peroxiredoxin
MVRSSMLCLGLALLLGACKPALRPDGGRGLLPVGAIAPDVIGTTGDGRSTTLSAARGHAAVVYFYPKDETPGCTKEACAFRDVFKKYEARHVAIFGVSRDSEESHKKFRAKHALPFPLVSDGDGTIADAYGVSSTLGMTSRVTFLVGVDGMIVRVWPDVDPGTHADEVLAAVEAALAAGPKDSRTSTGGVP